MAYGGEEGLEVVSRSRRSGGMFHDEVAQGRGGERLATPRNRGRLGVMTRKLGGRKGGAAVLMLLSTNA